MPDGSELLSLYARQGDLKALETFVEGHSKRLRAFLRGLLPTEEDADDALQETWMRVIRFCGAYHGGSATGYVMRIARSVVADRYRRSGLKTVSLDAEDEEGVTPAENVADDRPSPDETFETKATAEDVRQAVRALPLRQREVLLLRIEGGLAFREIAEELSIPLGTALTWMHEATKKLKKTLGART